MKSMHDRKIVFAGVALTRGSMKHDWKILNALQDYVERMMIDSGYLENAPFLWIGIVFRYGLKNETVPHYRRINKKYGELGLALELDMRVLLTADETDVDLLKEFFEIATLDALIHAGQKYGLKIDALVEWRHRLGRIPDWEETMEEHPELLKTRYRATKPPSH
jgi:hypothetical protein